MQKYNGKINIFLLLEKGVCMALSININVNNSDISIKNSKTGAKKNIKSISAGNLNDMTDREFNISQKRKIARKQAMKLISDAWDKDNKAA